MRNLRSGAALWGAVFLIAALLRLRGIGFGLPAINDPDELMFELGAFRMLSGPTLNPGWFGHPATTTMYLLAVLDVLVFAVSWAAGLVGGIKGFAEAVYHNPAWLILPHRLAMVGFSLGCVALTARLAARIWRAEEGTAQGRGRAEVASIGAAALLAFNPVFITWSQVVRSDVMACLFLLLALLACCDVAERGRRGDWLRSGAWIGVAVATKWPFALGLFGLFGATLIGMRRTGELGRHFLLLCQGVLCAVVVLVLVSPYLVLAWPTVVANLAGEAQQHHLGATGGGPAWNLAWYLRSAIWPAVLAGGAALIVIGAWAGRRNDLLAVIVALPALAFLAVMMAQHIVWERWAIPLMPLLAVLGGGGLARVWDLAGGRSGLRVGVLVAVFAPLAWSAWNRGTERSNDTRQLAARWAHEHVPAGATVMVEHFGFDLLDGPWRLLFPLASRGCMDVRATLAGRFEYGMIEQGRAGRSNVDYGTLLPERRSTCAADWAILTQADRYAAERQRFPQEWDAYRRLLSSGTVVLTLRPEPGRRGGPVVRIVRFDK